MPASAADLRAEKPSGDHSRPYLNTPSMSKAMATRFPVGLALDMGEERRGEREGQGATARRTSCHREVSHQKLKFDEYVTFHPPKF